MTDIMKILCKERGLTPLQISQKMNLPVLEVVPMLNTLKSHGKLYKKSMRSGEYWYPRISVNKNELLKLLSAFESASLAQLSEITGASTRIINDILIKCSDVHRFKKDRILRYTINTDVVPMKIEPAIDPKQVERYYDVGSIKFFLNRKMLKKVKFK